MKLIIFVVLFVSISSFLLIHKSTGQVKGIFSIFASPTATATPTPIPTLTPTPTATPTPTPTLKPTLTPTSTPRPTPTSMPATSFESYFDEFSTQYQVDKNKLKKIAFCESGMNPGAASGPYGGMYQFTAETWQSTRALMGKDTDSGLRFNSKEAIATAAFKISRNGEKAWANCL